MTKAHRGFATLTVMMVMSGVLLGMLGISRIIVLHAKETELLYGQQRAYYLAYSGFAILPEKCTGIPSYVSSNNAAIYQSISLFWASPLSGREGDVYLFKNAEIDPEDPEEIKEYLHSVAITPKRYRHILKARLVLDGDGGCDVVGIGEL